MHIRRVRQLHKRTDSNAQRLGVKAFAGELITGGSIIMRQRGTRIKRASTWASALTILSSPRLRPGEV